MKAMIWIVLVWVLCGGARICRAELVACVGDSITYGSGISDRTRNSYPAQLERILRQYDLDWEVRNFGVSGATLLRSGDRPYVLEGAYTSAKASGSDIVIIKLGTNDSKPQNWVFQDEFVADYGALIDSFRALPSEPEVWICKPVPAFRINFGIRPEVIEDEILPLIEQIAEEKDVPVIDLFTPMLHKASLFPDGIHPNAEGAGLIARTVAPFLLGVRFLPDFNRDGVLNLVDFVLLAGSWTEADPAMDVSPAPDGDGIVGYDDLAGLSRFWMSYPGAVAHWKLDEVEGELAADSLGDVHGTLHGSPRWRPIDGHIGGAVELDGIDDYISTGSVLNPADGPFTVFAWVRGGLPGRAILSQADESARGELWLGTDPGAGALMTALTDGSRGISPLLSETVVTDGNWHRVRFVWDGASRYLYLDGQALAADSRKLGNLKFSNAGMRIGAGCEREPDGFWSGLIDDVRIYNRAIRP